MATATFVKKSRKDWEDESGRIIVKKGESYWWWQFAFNPRTISKIKPRRSQLTKSNYLQRVYDIEDDIMNTTSDFESARENRVADIEDLINDQNESLQNMPEHLHDSPVGSLLQERIESLENWISELSVLDLSDENEDSRNALINCLCE